MGRAILRDVREGDQVKPVPLVVPYALGRVAPSWNFRELHSQMKWDVGFGIRGMMRKFVGRIDFAVSKEGSSVWVLVGQPF